jgi:hypothetical protein
MRTGLVTLVVLLAALSTQSAVGGDSRVDVRRVQSLPCTRAGVAEAALAFTALLNEKRFDATRLIWLPKRRVPTPAFFWTSGGGRYLRATRGREIPGVTRRWFARGGTSIEVILVNPRINPREPARTGFAVEWIRRDEAGGSLVRGTGKGGWDCEKRRISMFGGGERPVASVEGAREEAAGHCGRGYRTFHRYAQTAYLCRLPRGATS